EVAWTTLKSASDMGNPTDPGRIFGGEQARNRFAVLDALRQDIRQSIRTFRRNPGVIATAALSLALGISAATGLFTVVYDVVVNPYPLVAADRLFTFAVVDKLNIRGLVVTARQLIELQHSDILDGVTAVDTWTMTLTGTGLPEPVSAQYFSTNGLSSVYRLT